MSFILLTWIGYAELASTRLLGTSNPLQSHTYIRQYAFETIGLFAPHRELSMVMAEVNKRVACNPLVCESLPV